MAEIDHVADALHRLIQTSPTSPSVDQLRLTLITATSGGARDMLLPGLMDFLGEWNQKHHDQRIEGDIHDFGEGGLVLEIADEPKHRVGVPVDWRLLTKLPPAEWRSYFNSVLQSALPKVDE